MARVGVDYETIKQTAIKLLSQGLAPSVQKIREALGTGSNTTIAEHLKVWRDEYAKKTIHHLPANMPKELISTFEVLWQTAMEHAQNQLAEYKKAVESKCEIALQKEHEAEKLVNDLTLKREELSMQLSQEISNKQKLTVELAIVNDRLIKQDGALTSQKNQYEDRLNRVYEEKDILITECRHLKDEIKTLQTKLTLQAEKHQDILSQQNALQEQSETRWLKLIDQARQETREIHKKLEIECDKYNKKIMGLESKIHSVQQEFYNKNSQLNVVIEDSNKLKETIKILESENSKIRLITTFKRDKNKKHVIANNKKSKMAE